MDNQTLALMGLIVAGVPTSVVGIISYFLRREIEAIPRRFTEMEQKIDRNFDSFAKRFDSLGERSAHHDTGIEVANAKINDLRLEVQQLRERTHEQAGFLQALSTKMELLTRRQDG